MLQQALRFHHFPAGAVLVQHRVARRLSCERVALVLTSREDHGESGARRSVPTVEITGLSPDGGQ